MGANINVNLQERDNYSVILVGNEQFKSEDVVFYIKKIPIPSMSILSADVDTLVNLIKFPAQGRMNYGDLSLEILADDNLNSYLELAKWLNRLKNPEVLLQKHINASKLTPMKQIINSTNQHEIEYRDMRIIITDRSHQKVLEFVFRDTWISEVSGLDLDAQSSDYISFDAKFNFLLMETYDSNGNRIFPQLDNVQVKL